jgi:outer membrane receptor protein involved in Fe transport
VSGFDRGNPNLGEEKGNSWTLGLVVTPRSIPALSNVALTIDYFNIKIDDAIVPTPRQFILDQCYGGDASFCQFITRRPAAVGANSAGSLQFIDSAQTNSGELVTKGVDVTLSYGDTIGPGRFDGRLSWTYLIEGYITPLPGSDRDHFKGEVPGDSGFGAPKNKGYLTLGYKWNQFAVRTQTTYIGRMALDDQFLKGFDLARGSITVPSKVYNDVQFTYSPMKWVDFYLGVDNVFDEEPAPIISGLPGNITGTETAADIYDAIGRRYYVGFRMRL